MSNNINGMVKEFEVLNLAPKPQRRQGRRRRRNAPRQLVVVPAQNGNGTRRKRRKNRRAKQAMMNCEDGSIRLRRCEHLVTVKADKAGVISQMLTPSDSGLIWLARLTKAYSRMVWHSARLIYKPAVGTTIDGEVAFGVDWDAKGEVPTTKGQIYQYSPSADGPVWRPIQLVLPSGQLMSRKEYLPHSDQPEEQSPGKLYVWAPGAKEYGSIWVDYDVTLKGTQAPK